MAQPQRFKIPQKQLQQAAPIIPSLALLVKAVVLIR